MFRIDNANSVGVPPAVPAPGSEQYFTEAAPATQVPDWWLNMIQEELRNIAILKGATPTKTSLDQCSVALSMAVLAVESHASDTGHVSPTNDNVVLASFLSRANATDAAVVASNRAVASGNRSAVVASFASANGDIDASGNESFVAACSGQNSTDPLGATGTTSAVIASADAAAEILRAASWYTFVAASKATSAQTQAAGTGTSILSSIDTGQCQGDYSFTAACDDAATGASGDYSAILASDAGAYTGAIQSFVAACGNCYSSALAFYGAVIASDTSYVAASKSLVAASDDCNTNGSESAILASDDCATQAANTFIAAADGNDDAKGQTEVNSQSSAIIAAERVQIGGAGITKMLVASARCELATANALALGYHATTTPTFSGSDQNLTIRFEGNGGNGYFDGGADLGAADYAELFENLAAGVLEVGSVVAFEGDRVRYAEAGDTFVRVVSAAPGIVGNSASLGWQGRYQLDEWGRPVEAELNLVRWPELSEVVVGDEEVRFEAYDGPKDAAPELRPKNPFEYTNEDGVACCAWHRKADTKRTKSVTREAFDGLVRDAGPKKSWPKDAEQYTATGRVELDSFDPAARYVSRRDRPAEWTVVGLLGQLRTRVDDTVAAGDLVVGGAGGVGTKGAAGALRCMTVLSPYDADRGYAIAKVLAL